MCVCWFQEAQELQTHAKLGNYVTIICGLYVELRQYNITFSSADCLADARSKQYWMMLWVCWLQDAQELQTLAKLGYPTSCGFYIEPRQYNISFSSADCLAESRSKQYLMRLWFCWLREAQEVQILAKLVNYYVAIIFGFYVEQRQYNITFSSADCLAESRSKQYLMRLWFCWLREA